MHLLKARLITFWVFLILGVSSCSHLQSGQYVQVRRGDTVNSLAKEFGVTAVSILNANRGKQFREGEWYFIPMLRGFARYLSEEVDFGTGYGFTQASLYAGKLLWPVPSNTKISSNFGKRWGKKHEGIDIPGRKGTVLLAAEDGKVIYSGNGLKGYGNLIIIAHKGGLRTVYAHNKSNVVKKGQQVARGQVIGYMGATGHATGPHLHFEVRHYDRPVNPMAYIEKSRKVLVSYKD